MPMTKSIEIVAGLSQLVGRYDAILCDVWGVLHNGVQVWQETARALTNARHSGMAVVMITNAPRPKAPVLKPMENQCQNRRCISCVDPIVGRLMVGLTRLLELVG